MTNDCIAWAGRHRKEDGRPMQGNDYAYRLAWEAEHGPVPAGQVLHHTCENSWCINPKHLRPMGRAGHLREHGLTGDWGQADKTHCPAGHAYDQANTYTYRTKDGSTERHCRACRQAAKKRYRQRTGRR